MRIWLARSGSNLFAQERRAGSQESEHMMACEHHDDLVALGAMRLLAPEDESRLAERIRACASCRRQFEEYQTLVRLMPHLMRVEKVSARADAAQSAPGNLNGSRPARASTQEPPASAEREPTDLFAPRRWGTPILPRQRRARAGHRLTTLVSGVAVAVLLIGLIVGFRLLTLGRVPPARGQTPTPVTHLACPAPSNGHPQPVTCGVLVVDSVEGVVVLDSATLQPLSGLRPLPLNQANNVLLSALSADQRTLALVTGFNKGSLYFPSLQVVALDSWKISQPVDMSSSGMVVQGLAVSADGSAIYIVATSYTGSGVAQTQLHYYTYQRGQGAGVLEEHWSQPFPVVPEAGAVALSADGKTIYAFSDSSSPPEVAAIPLKDNGIDTAHIHTLLLPSVASGLEPPPSYDPSTQPVASYHPAVLFAPDDQTLYLVHADQAHPEQDWLTVVALGPEPTKLQELQIQGDSLPASSGGAIMQRHEWGVLSSDGKTLYVTGVVKTFTPAQDGGFTQQDSYLGLRAITTQTGQVSRHWFEQDTFYSLGISGDGTRLYLAGQPSTGAKPIAHPSALLAFSLETGTLQSHEMSGVEALFVLSSAKAGSR